MRPRRDKGPTNATSAFTTQQSTSFTETEKAFSVQWQFTRSNRGRRRKERQLPLAPTVEENIICRASTFSSSSLELPSSSSRSYCPNFNFSNLQLLPDDVDLFVFPFCQNNHTPHTLLPPAIVCNVPRTFFLLNKDFIYSGFLPDEP